MKHICCSKQIALASLLLASGLAGTAQAYNFEVGDVSFEGSVNLSAGVNFRTQKRDARNVGKLNNNPALCSRSSPLGRGCQGNTSEREFQAATGRFSPNTDNGNLNFDQHDITYTAFKATTDLTINWGDFGFYGRTITVLDPKSSSRKEYHPSNFGNDGLQPEFTSRTAEQDDVVGYSAQLEDAYIFGNFDIFDRFVTIKLGSQNVQWGEQLVLVPNSVNSINAPNLVRLHTPGFDLKELFDPVEMAFVNFGITDSTTAQALYLLN